MTVSKRATSAQPAAAGEEPSPGRHARAHRREAVAVLGLAVALAAVFTYPLVAGFGELGRIRPNDGRWSIWVTAWVAHALTSEPWRLYDANIFYPHRHALAFSEPNLGAGLLAAPVYALTRNPIAAHNAAFFAAFVLAFCAAYALAHHVVGRRAPAALAGILFAFCPYVLSHTAHIQLLMTFGLPLTLLAVQRFAERPSGRRAGAMGAAVAVQALFCAYYGVLAAVLAVFGVVYFAVASRWWRSARYWALAALGAAVGLTVAPPYLPFIASAVSDGGFARTLDDARLFSADWRAYLASAAWAHRWMLPLIGSWKEVLFPGFVAIPLGIAGAWLGLAARCGSPSRALVLFYILIVLSGLWLSFGPDAGLYGVLFDHVPGFAFLRAPSRFGIAVPLGLGVLAAIAVARLAASPRPAARILAVAVPVVAAAELLSAPLPFERMPPPPRVYERLARLPRGPVAELPFFYERHDISRHALYMLFSTYHWQPLVNGYSDYIPPDFHELARVMQTFPAEPALRALRDRRVRYIVVHLHAFAPDQRARLRDALAAAAEELRVLLVEGTIVLYELVPEPSGMKPSGTQPSGGGTDPPAGRQTDPPSRAVEHAGPAPVG
ncbi:MAG TPA: hypothetical protein VNI83_00445 [Vicinamibacterales bacterium]|nr:hypothetical protein [Vicinamibacterales bacterium]